MTFFEDLQGVFEKKKSHSKKLHDFVGILPNH